MQQRATHHPSLRAKRRRKFIVLFGAIVLYFAYFSLLWTDPTIPNPTMHSFTVPMED
jgi:hypothetical protein